MKRYLTILLLFVGLAAPGATHASGGGALLVHPELRHSSGEAFRSDRIIVKFKPGVPGQVIENLNREAGGRPLQVTKYADFHLIGLPADKTVGQMVEIYNRNPNVEYAEPDFIVTASMIPDDPYYLYQWHLAASSGGIRMPAAWDRSTGSGVVVAVVDTGIAYEDYFLGGTNNYYRAPDLAATSFVPGYDFINNDAHANDDNSHGTHVAGTIAQSTNNGVGVAGVAFNATLMPIKVLNKQGSGSDSGVAQGIRFAADNGAKVVNLSLGGESSSTTLGNAVTYAHNLGVVVVAASGNNNGPVGFPAAYPEAIAVGATRYDEARSGYSNYGPKLDVVAPGGDTGVDQNADGYPDGVLQQTFNPGTKNKSDFGYYFFQGTSMATPHVAGLAALILAQNPSLTPADVKARLTTTAKDLGEEGWDQYYGNGLIDADAAVAPTSMSLTVSPLNLGAVVAGLTTWEGDDSKNKPVAITANAAWKLTAIASDDFTDGGGTTINSTSIRMGPGYNQVVGIPKTGSAVQIGAGGPGTGLAPAVNTTLDIPWLEGLAGKAFTTTITYTVVPQ